MRTGRPTTQVKLSPDERQELESLAHRSRSAPHVARRARIILACADGGATTRVAKRLHVSATTVCKWRTRFLEDRLDGLFDEPRPGFLEELRAACTRRGVLLIFDEMWTGFRVALGGAQQHFGVTADLACFSKAVANGMPPFMTVRNRGAGSASS